VELTNNTSLTNNNQIPAFLNNTQSALGYNDTVLGYNDTVLGYNDTVLGYNDSVLGYNDSVLGYNDSAPVYSTQFNNSNSNLSDPYTVLHLKETAERRNFTEELTTELPADVELLSNGNLNNESSQTSLILQSLGNQKLNNSRSQSEDKRSNDLKFRDQSGKYLQELSPKQENIKLKSYPASGMVNKTSQE